MPGALEAVDGEPAHRPATPIQPRPWAGAPFSQNGIVDVQSLPHDIECLTDLGKNPVGGRPILAAAGF